MIDLYPYLRPLLMAMEPETAHKLVLWGLKAGGAPAYQNSNPLLKTTLWNRDFPNPLGLAAGFDKDAEVIAPLFRMGFGFVEAGTVTPLPQPGNDRPRIFRDIASQSVINRMGFPGRGLEAFTKNILAFRKNHPAVRGILGVNIGINKNTPAPLEDYKKCLAALAPFADYVTINVSSPNTAGLRDLQGQAELDRLLMGLKSEVPLLLKIAPDLTPVQREDIAALALRHKISGLVISNTTITRPAVLAPELMDKKGGLSGLLLKNLSTEVIRDFYRLTQGAIPIVGVGGIASAEDAYEKIRAGASLVQVYTALTYQGPALITRILEGLVRLLQKDGFRNISEAVGSEMGSGKVKAKSLI